MYNDIFISYRNDAEGMAIGRALKSLLESKDFSVYFNPDEQNEDFFPKELEDAVLNCQDFVLVMTEGCLNRLLINARGDYLCEEVRTAHKNKKHFVPILIEGVNLPKEDSKWPEEFRFLFYVNYIDFPLNPDRFNIAPINLLKSKLQSKPEKGDIYRNTYNSNKAYDVIADFNKLREKAKNKDYDAIYELSIIYYYGLADELGGSDRNYEEAYNCFKILSETENKYTSYAINMIGHMYYSGTIPFDSQSYEKSLAMHKIAAESLSAAARHMAYMLSIGSGCEFNYKEIVELFEKAAQGSDTSTRHNLAEFYYEYAEYSKAAELYKSLYSMLPEAALKLGRMYKKGILSTPPKPDYFMAAYYFQHVIQCGKCGYEPYYELGRLYFNPTGNFPKDFSLAAKNFKIAADMGHRESQYMLGYMYDAGHVGRDIKKAIYYHEMAAKQGHLRSAEALATLYQQHECKNYSKAFRYAKMAAQAGLSMGEFLYGNLLFFGRGCEADMNEAYIMYKNSYEHGYTQAGMMLDKIEKFIIHKD